MTDVEVNYQNMALQVLRVLTEGRPAWEKAYKKLLPDYEALQKALDTLGDKARQRSGSSSRGYTDAKDVAELAMLDAAMPVVQGLKTLYLEGGHAALGKVAGYSRSGLDRLRGPAQVAALEEVAALAQPLADELAEELVTDEHLQLLTKRVAAYQALLGTPRAEINAGSLLREAAVQHLAEARAAIARLDVRVPNLRATLPDLVAAYEKARIIVDAGHGPKGKPDAPKA